MILLIKGEQKAVTRRILTIGLKGVNKFGPQTIFMLVIGKVAKWQGGKLLCNSAALQQLAKITHYTQSMCTR
ncbi:MAG: hypothetical protein R6X34_30500 [Chloroflexota bacterium]